MDSEQQNKLSNKVIGKIIEVHRELGPGLLENTYKECLYHTLVQEGLKVEKEKAIPVVYKNIKLECGYRLDLLVEEKLVIEIKSVEALKEVHMAQTLTYPEIRKI